MSARAALLLLACLAATPARAQDLSPEEFLITLCDTAGKPGGDVFWARSASPSGGCGTVVPESLAATLRAMHELSVVPGPPSLLEVDSLSFEYTVSFPEAAWSWIDEDGRLHRATGSTVVTSSGGRFMWVELPAFRPGAGLSPADKLMAGFALTIMLLLAGAAAIWWARRSLGVSGRDQ